MKIENGNLGIILMVQWLRPYASNAGCMGSIPSQGTNISCVTWNGKKIFKYTNKIKMAT